MCYLLKGKFIIEKHTHTFNMHTHRLKYKSPKFGFSLKSQELPMFDGIKEDLLNF